MTGGLTFAGGPLNNYVTHSIATMVDVLRNDAGSTGLVSANGGFLTKHAFGVYSTSPPAEGFSYADVQSEVDATGQREFAGDFEGPVTIESNTVMFGKEGPDVGLFACRLDDGRRAWGNTTDADTMQLMTTEETIGRPAKLTANGTVELA